MRRRAGKKSKGHLRAAGLRGSELYGLTMLCRKRGLTACFVAIMKVVEDAGRSRGGIKGTLEELIVLVQDDRRHPKLFRFASVNGVQQMETRKMVRQALWQSLNR